MVALSGCGGGGKPAAQTPVDSDVIRQLQVDDIVTYSIDGTFKTANQSLVAYAIIQSTTCASEIPPKHGGRALKMVMEIEITLSDHSHINDTRTAYLEQTSNGTIYEVGMENGNGQITLTSSIGKPIVYRSPVTSNSSYGYNATYSDGSRVGYSTNVRYKEATGYYWMVRQTTTSSGVTSGYESFDPSAGYPEMKDVEWKLTTGTLSGKCMFGSSVFPAPEGISAQ